jgi:hypothetical protein
MKHEIVMTSVVKNIKKRNKDLSKLTEVVNKLANNIELKNNNVI